MDFSHVHLQSSMLVHHNLFSISLQCHKNLFNLIKWSEIGSIQLVKYASLSMNVLIEANPLCLAHHEGPFLTNWQELKKSMIQNIEEDVTKDSEHIGNWT